MIMEVPTTILKKEKEMWSKNIGNKDLKILIIFKDVLIYIENSMQSINNMI